MKLAVLEYLIVGAGLVAANPLRVIMVSSHSEVSTNLRFGLPVVHANNHVAQVNAHNLITEAGSQTQTGAGRRPSCRFRQKAVGISNAFRKVLGMPPIEEHYQPGTVHILPFIGTPPIAVTSPEEGKGTPVAIQPHFRHRHGYFHRLTHDSNFLTRLHFALMSLGPWEGRAVAFVLGCGIGVLLRMFWVLAVISYRAIRGQKEDETEYTHIVEYVDAEEIFVAPPDYSLADEKVHPEEDTKVPVA